MHLRGWPTVWDVCNHALFEDDKCDGLIVFKIEHSRLPWPWVEVRPIFSDCVIWVSNLRVDFFAPRPLWVWNTQSRSCGYDALSKWTNPLPCWVCQQIRRDEWMGAISTRRCYMHDSGLMNNWPASALWSYDELTVFSILNFKKVWTHYLIGLGWHSTEHVHWIRTI